MIAYALIIIFSAGQTNGGVTSNVLHFKTLEECMDIHKQVTNINKVSTIGCVKVIK